VVLMAAPLTTEYQAVRLGGINLQTLRCSEGC
jgi:hypothetical protein